VRIREAVPGDAVAIARVHRDGAAYYSGLAPDLFRMPDDDGLVDYVKRSQDDSPSTTLFIVADIDDQVVGHLYAELITPTNSDRFLSSRDMAEQRLFIHALSVLREFWRQGIATALVERAEEWGRERGATIALCDTWLDSPVSVPFWQQRMGYERRSVRLRKRLTA
jgi:GNAT superfamily N-acetyltransferase